MKQRYMRIQNTYYNFVPMEYSFYKQDQVVNRLVFMGRVKKEIKIIMASDKFSIVKTPT